MGAMVVTLLRWLAVPVVVGLVGYLTVRIARWSVTLADAQCQNMVGGACVESWHTGVVEWAIYIAIVVGLLVMLSLAVWVAPAVKRWVAVVLGVLAVGVLWAPFILTGWAALMGPALLGSLISILVMVWVWRQQTRVSG